MEMKFKSLTNEIYELESHSNDTVLSVKKNLSEKLNVPFDCIKLIFKNKILFDNDLISEYNIGLNEFVLYDCDIGCKKSISIRVDNYTGIGDKCFDCEVNRDDKIECLRDCAKDRDCGSDSVEFFFRESILSIDKSFRYYGIIDGDRVVMARDRNNKNEILIVRVRVWRGMNARVYSLRVKGTDTVGILKKDVLRQQEFDDIKYMTLLFCDLQLEDNERTLIDYGVRDGDSIRVIICGSMWLHLIPINIKREPIEYPADEASKEADKVIISKAISAILKKLNIDEKLKSSVKLYQNPNKSIRINKDSGIAESLLPNGLKGYQIYYSIKLIDGNLIRNKVLGQGAFGTVYLCTDIDSNTQKALKEFNVMSRDKKKHCETDFYKKLGDHPRIIKYERHFEIHTASFILMEYMPGGSIASYLKINGALSEGKISKYAKQICEGLKYIHEKLIIHRDIKGDNILLDSNDDIKLADFGLSLVLEGLDIVDFLNKAAKSDVGTVNWKAPEIMKGEQYGCAADIWSFGATMVEMVTGHPLFDGMNLFQVTKMINTGASIDFSYPPNSSDQIKSFIDFCLQAEQKKRQTAKELLDHAFLS